VRDVHNILKLKGFPELGTWKDPSFYMVVSLIVGWEFGACLMSRD
jgi:lipid-binding SYLF domain-containing protein